MHQRSINRSHINPISACQPTTERHITATTPDQEAPITGKGYLQVEISLETPQKMALLG